MLNDSAFLAVELYLQRGNATKGARTGVTRGRSLVATLNNDMVMLVRLLKNF